MRALTGDLDGLMNPMALTSSIEWLLISLWSGGSEAKSEKNTSTKSAYLTGIFVEASLAIKPTIGSTSSGEELGDTSELSDAICITKVSLSGSSAAATNSEVYG